MKLRIAFPLLLVLFLSGCALTGAGVQTEAQPVPNQALTPALPDALPTPESAVTPTPTPPAEPTPETTPQATPTPDPYDYTLPVPPSEPVENSWFDDAVFIGDSRTDGLRLFGGIKNTTFLCYKGLSVFEVMENKPVIQMGGQKQGVLEALDEAQYGKVYLSLGLNELGYRDDQGYYDTYSAVVDAIRELQPDADIYLQLLLPVNSRKCAETDQPHYVTNQQIAVYNGIIRTIAAEKQVYLLDVGEYYADESGELPYDASSDGIHFLRTGYPLWFEYLKTHTVQKEGNTP